MVGFSKTIKQLPNKLKWIAEERKKIKSVNQRGSGKIAKKRHAELKIEKSRKLFKKAKKRA